MMQVLRMKDVIKKTGLCRSAIYKFIRNNSFPRPIKMGEKATGWVDSEIDDWILSKMANRTVDTSSDK